MGVSSAFSPRADETSAFQARTHIMKRIFFLFFVFGPLAISLVGCVSQAQMNMQHALFVQEYRQLEDELFLAYQNMDHLARSNASLRAQLGQEAPENGDRSLTRPGITPISTEGLSPSNQIPDILQNSSSLRPQVRPLPKPVEQAQYVEPEFASRPQKPLGNTTAELPIWRPNR